MHAKVLSAGPFGIEAFPVEVEVNVSRQGFSNIALVGLPDAAVKESLDSRHGLIATPERIKELKEAEKAPPAGDVAGGAVDKDGRWRSAKRCQTPFPFSRSREVTVVGKGPG